MRRRGTNCTDLDNAKDGVRTMLKLFNPPSAEIGMIAFPPLESTASEPCDAPSNSGGNGYNAYDSPGSRLRDGHRQRGATGTRQSDGLKHDSGLYVHTEDGPAASCIQAGGNTSYSEALRQAQAELLAHGRPNVPDYIVFLTDGEANIGSVYGPAHPTTRWQRRRPEAVPDRNRPRQRLQGGRHDDLQHRLRARQQRQLHGRRLPQEGRGRQLGRVHRQGAGC